MALCQYSCFVVVAEELNLGRAAGRVHVAPPAFSTLIQALGRAIGVQLFVHSKSRVEPAMVGSRTLFDVSRRTSPFSCSMPTLFVLAHQRNIAVSTIFGLEAVRAALGSGNPYGD
jgi:hypothetical protein